MARPILVSAMAHNLATKEAAKIQSDKMSKEFIKSTLEVRKIGDVKANYNEYIAGLKVKAPDPEVKIIEKTNTIEKIKQEKKVAEFQFSEVAKNNFSNAHSDSYTINVTSFNDKKELEDILIKNPNLYENSYAFDYSNGKSLVRWNYGIYPTYNEAQKAIETLGEIGDGYYPVVQKVSKELELYNSNLPVKVELEQKPVEYEYVNVSTNTEYKEAVPLNNDELKENKKLENVVKKVKASQIDVSLTESENEITIAIADNGTGFDLETAEVGNGLNTMKKRASELKGNFNIESTEKGTKIYLSLPNQKEV